MVLFFWQQKRYLMQGHVNWPRCCSHVHKGQFPAWEEMSTSCRPRKLLCSGAGFNFNAPALFWTVASDVTNLLTFSIYPPFYLVLYHLNQLFSCCPFPLFVTRALKRGSSLGSIQWLMGGNWVIQGQYCSFSPFFYSAAEFVSCGDLGFFMASVMRVMFRFSCAGNIWSMAY